MASSQLAASDEVLDGRLTASVSDALSPVRGGTRAAQTRRRRLPHLNTEKSATYVATGADHNHGELQRQLR
jgi:hypothetical protein